MKILVTINNSSYELEMQEDGTAAVELGSAGKAEALNEILKSLPAEIGRYALTITRYFNPEIKQLMWSMTYECSADGTIHPGCDINEADFEEGARKLNDWLRDNGYITERDNNALAHLMGYPVAEVDNLIDSITL